MLLFMWQKIFPSFDSLRVKRARMPVYIRHYPSLIGLSSTTYSETNRDTDKLIELINNSLKVSTLF